MPTPQIDLGRLLRMRGMVIGASQVEATRDAGIALVRAYAGLREELLRILEPETLRELHDEFERLFPPMAEPLPWHPMRGVIATAELAAASSEAKVNLQKIQGWIQGLIDELTLDQKMRMEAEETAKLASRVKPGFRNE
jgi:hypothetical protein